MPNLTAVLTVLAVAGAVGSVAWWRGRRALATAQATHQLMDAALHRDETAFTGQVRSLTDANDVVEAAEHIVDAALAALLPGPHLPHPNEEEGGLS